MDTSKHTPGPWRVLTRKNIRGPVINVCNVGNEVIVASPTGDISITDEADAAFIVKACNAHDDLMTALRAALDVAENNQESIEFEMLTGETHAATSRRMLRDARAVLARAGDL